MGLSPTIETVFELLHDGKECEKQQSFWIAADKFGQASSMLTTLAQQEQQQQQQQQRSTEEEEGEEEEKQIATLYENQALEYLNKSRGCLIRAMQREKERDEEQGGGRDLHTSLTDDEAKTRTSTFSFLFSKALPLRDGVDDTNNNDKGVKGGSNTTNSEEDNNNTLSLEERLRALNESLPSGFKTSEERMDDINRGLNRLGLSSLYTQQQQQKAPFARFEEIAIPKDEDEQVEDIIAQAQDEVNFEKNFAAVTTTPSSNFKSSCIDPNSDDDDTDDDDDKEEVEEEEEDAFLDDDILAIKNIRKKVVKAQVKLAELVALLDEARSSKEQEEKDDLREEEGEDSDVGSDVERNNGGSSLEYLASGKKKLTGAKRDLGKALDAWKSDLLL